MEKHSLKEAAVAIIGTVAGTALGAVASAYITTQSEQAGIVEALSQRFDYVDETMSYEDALEAVYSETATQEKEVERLTQENTELSKKPDVTYFSPSLVRDGMEIAEEARNSVVRIGGQYYALTSTAESFIDGTLFYDEEQNALFGGTNTSAAAEVTRVNIFDTNILYDGVSYKLIHPVDGVSFSIAGNTYTEGAIFTRESSFHEVAYGLLNLQGNYSSLQLTIGRIDGSSKTDISLEIYLDGELSNSYAVSSDSTTVDLSIPLNYANSLKMQLTPTNSDVYEYGIINAILVK